MTTDTLHITVESTTEFFEEALADLRHLEAGEDLDDKYVLSLPDEEMLERVLTAKNIELLRTIAAERPSSIRELARLVDRDVKNVSTALSRLEEIGLIKFDRSGQAKQPTVWYNEVKIDIPLPSFNAEDPDAVRVG